MSKKFENPNNRAQKTAFGHAVVIGSSMAGLTAARVLTDYFNRVTIIERDRLPNAPQFRRGVPQARHAHTLPLRGQQLLEQKFPGLVNDLLAHGAISVDGKREMAFFMAGGWHNLRNPGAVVAMTCSRPLLESTIYRRLVDHPNVRVIQEHQVPGLCVDRHRQRVTGVRLRHRHGQQAEETELAADLVVDASGRNSQAPQWLAEFGFAPPRESTVNAFTGYATRIYRQPANVAGRWKTLYIRPTPPKGTRGGAIVPIEGNRWYVTLIGMGGDYPPTNEAEFLAYARTLPTPDLYEAIQEATPLTRVYGYRHVENRVRHYEALPRYLEGFLVCGDAAVALNPVYAQGMTASAMGSVALDNSLRHQLNLPQADKIAGLAQSFQKQLSRIEAGLWKTITTQDRRWPTAQVTHRQPPAGACAQKSTHRPMQQRPATATARHAI